jgi:hypothetical protein
MLAWLGRIGIPVACGLCLLACSSAERECGGGCGEREFCCLGACTPLGESCGASHQDASSDASGITDALMSVDAPPGCAVPTGATSIDSVCVENVRTSCADEDERDCSPGERVCLDWIDGSAAAHASCVPPSETEPCDPAVETPRCDGNVARYCLAASAGPEPHPPGYVHRVDCEEHASDATCENGPSGPTCVGPSDVPCDPATFVATCAAYCASGATPATPGVVRSYPCPGGFCVQNEWSFHQPACVPTGAIENPGPNTDLRCSAGATIRVRRYGYEFDEPCSNRVIGDPGRCFDATPADVLPTCIATTATTCDPSTYTPSCVTSSRARYCDERWLIREEPCSTLEGSLLSPGPCDAETGYCVVGAPCVPDTFVPYCASPSYSIHCSAGRTVSNGPFPCAI